ncbi:unnamed protein product [Brachionus calyciflorus]|uniref:Uncharacterized protein n=1 Tax=Brachionus calyciflorus TaxID=104777 RepID=A0A813VBZ2_9BILA|nr:unnamed protein product [Brachionus calyciflorus]
MTRNYEYNLLKPTLSPANNNEYLVNQLCSKNGPKDVSESYYFAEFDFDYFKTNDKQVDGLIEKFSEIEIKSINDDEA